MDIVSDQFEIEGYLDLSNQGLQCIPEYILNMKNLKSITLSEGNSIQVSDRYKLLDCVPSLATIDGKDVSNIRTACNNLVEIFMRRLQELFLTKKASEIYNEESREQTRISKMVALAKQAITDGPEALNDFKEYKLEKLINENYDQYVSNALEANLPQTQQEIDPPSKKSKKSLTKSKKSSKSKHSPLKQKAPTLRLHYLLQTHSKNNNPKDFTTKVWMCEFEPDVENPGKTTNLVATCGGDSICFIDCNTGAVLKKYKEVDEEFYCISWTVIRYRNELTGVEKDFSMLAAAGISGDVKLIDPLNLICFERISYHKEPVDAILFHPAIPYFMFTGSEDRTIVLWDLGFPFSTDNRNSKRRLTLKTGHGGTVRQIAVFSHGKILVVACDDGMYAFNVSEPDTHSIRNPLYTFTFPNMKVKPLDSANCITNDLLVVKRVEEGLLYIFNSPSEFLENDATVLYRLAWRRTETPFLKFNFCPGSCKLLAGDDQGMIWSYDLGDLVHASKSKKNVVGFSLPKAEKYKCSNEYGKIFNHVAMSSEGRHLVGVTDRNVVAVWKLP